MPQNEQPCQIHVLAPANEVCNRTPEIDKFEEHVTRDFVGLNAPVNALTSGLLASPVQLDALMTGLKPNERLIAHLDFTTPNASGLSVEIVGVGATRRKALVRTTMLAKLLDAALASGLPFVEIVPRTTRAVRPKLRHACLLAPAGVTLPLGAAPIRARSGDAPAAYDWSAAPRDAIIFSPAAIGKHLAGLGAVLSAITGEIAIEVCMTSTTFDAALLKQIGEVRVHISDRLHADPTRYLRDERYIDAYKRLDDLSVVASAIKLAVTVRSKRALDACEISALSATLFGTPHDEHQTGHLAPLRSLYPRQDAVHSFFGIIAAAIGPALERSHVAVLDSLEGNVVGKLKSGHLIRMATAAPLSHTYMIGRPGSGKSTLLLNLIMQDIENGEAVVLIDPHGDLWEDVRARIPQQRLADLRLVHMGEPELQPKLNVLELGPGTPAEARARVVDSVYQLIQRLMFSGLTVNATGPMFNKYFRAAVNLLLEAEGGAARLEHIERIFADSDYRNELRRRPDVSDLTKEQWRQILNVSGNDHTIENLAPWVTSKLSQITQSAILRPILGASTTDLDFDQIFAKKQICLINLSSGRLGAEATALLGGVLTHRLEETAKRQEKKPPGERNKASIYFDEFHAFVSEFLRPLMAESRKYGLRIVLANQTLSQLVNNRVDGGIFHDVLGNCANTVVFAIDIDDARHLAPRFGGRIDPVDLVAQPNFQATCQFQTKSGTLGPFIVKTLPPPPLPG